METRNSDSTEYVYNNIWCTKGGRNVRYFRMGDLCSKQMVQNLAASATELIELNKIQAISSTLDGGHDLEND